MPTEPRSCRGAQLFGAWAIEPERFSRLVGVVRGMSMSEVTAQHAASFADGRSERPQYQMSGDGVAVIEVSGPITKADSSFSSMFGGTSTTATRRAIRRAIADPVVKSILLHIDSPGGTVDGVADLVDDIRKAGESKATWAFIEDLGASAGYWIACAADRVVANRTALVGSIGVFSVLEDSSGAAELAGIKVHVVRTGPHKGTGVDGTPITAETLADVQRVIDGTFRAFTGDVSASRGLKGEALDAVSTGQVWNAGDARKLGLVDAIDTLDTTISKLGRAKARRGGAKAAAATRSSHMPSHEDDARDTATTGIASNAAPPPATIAQLKAEFPGAGADFYLSCAEVGMTIEQASRKYASNLKAENAALRQKISDRDAEDAAAPKRVGVKPVPTAHERSEGEQRGEQSAKERVDSRIATLIRSGMSTEKAHQKVMRDDPELRAAYVKEVNDAKRSKK